MRARGLFIGGVILAVGIGSGVAVAEIPASNGTISACFIKSTGVLRVVDEAVACKKGEIRLDWNENGNKGDPGDPGTDGDDGADGAALTASSIYVGPTAQGSSPFPGIWVAESLCDPGDEVLGADHWFIEGTPTETDISRISPNGLHGMHLGLEGAGVEGEIRALCLDSTP